MIKHKILSYQIAKGQKHREYQHRAYTYDKLKKVGVVFSFADVKKYEAARDFIQTLKADGIEVVTMAYKPKDSESFTFDYFEEQDIGFFGTIEKDELQRFLNQKLEYLFCLDDDLNLYMQYLLVKSKVDTRIGAYHEAPDQASFFELMIKPRTSNNTKLLTEEIIHYVRKISGNY